ncbi:hypothetical protein QUB77_04130 [Microcoleus sp. AT9b-C3]
MELLPNATVRSPLFLLKLTERSPFSNRAKIILHLAALLCDKLKN